MNAAARQADPRSVTATEARSLLEEQESSDLSIAAFARQRGVRPWALYNARALARRRASREAEKAFSEVCVVEDDPPRHQSDNGQIELSLPSGLSLRIGAGFDEVTLRRVLGVLASC